MPTHPDNEENKARLKSCVTKYDTFLRDSLREYSKRLLENRIELLRLNIERRALKMQLKELSRHHGLALYAVMVRKQLDDNLKLMNITAKEQKGLKDYHSVYSSILCHRTPRHENE